MDGLTSPATARFGEDALRPASGSDADSGRLTRPRGSVNPGGSVHDAAVLLVGHGSHLSGGSSAPVREMALRLRGSGAFPELRVAFWKEEPSLRHAFDLVLHRRVYVVPVFTSEGYFTEEVLPRELGIRSGRIPQGLEVIVCPAVGTHPSMQEIARLRAEEAGSGMAVPPADTVLVVLGHGTGLHPRSGETTEALARSLRGTGRYRGVVSAFLDQPPELDAVLDGIDAAAAIVLPFFIAEGWHGGTTIPRDLAVEGREGVRGRMTLRYARPIGTHPAMDRVVRELVAGAGGDGAGAPGRSGVDLPGVRARDAFRSRLSGVGSQGLDFLQVAVLPGGTPEGFGSRGAEVPGDDRGGLRYELRHAHDRDRPAFELDEVRSAEGLEALAATTAEGGHRPLRTAPDLRGGWRAPGLTMDAVWEALALLYGAAPVHCELKGEGWPAPTPWRETAERQSGIYKRVGGMAPAGVAAMARELCGADRCLRTPRWPGSGSWPLRSEVPCPEACSLLVSEARRRLRG